MAVINDPNTVANVAQVGITSTASSQNYLHVRNAPGGYGALGHYKYAGFTGILPAALGANSEIFQFRWSHASNLAVITRVTISACVSTTFFAAGVPVQIDMVLASGWSVAGTLGTAPTLSATCKSRTSMASSSAVAGDIRIATTAALGAGTKSLEANSVKAIAAPGPITSSLNGQIIAPGTILYASDPSSHEHHIVLGGAGGGASSNGFVIRSVAVPATGTWTAAVAVEWYETTAY